MDYGNIGEALLVSVVAGTVSSAVTVGVITTKIEWLRSDVSRHESYIRWLMKRMDAWLHKMPSPEKPEE